MMSTNEISGNSRFVILGDHIATQKGYAFKSEWYTNTGRQILKVSNFTVDSIDVKEIVCIPEEIALEYLRYELKEGDVVIQTVGSWPNNPQSVVGKAIRIPYEASGALLNQNAVKLTPDDEVDNSYLFHLLRSKLFKSYIIGTAQGAANQASITLESIRSFSFYLPTLAVQRKIASILSAYDDLIENNARRIKILEEMAQAIYREWFVEFRIPNVECRMPNGEVRMSNVELRMATPEEKKLTGKPARQRFGGDLFPKGWEVKTLGDALVVLESGSRPKGGIDDSELGVPSIGAENIIGLGKYEYSKEKYVSREFYEKMNRGKVESGDVLLYKDGANIGRKSMFQDGFPHKVCCINEHVFILRTNESCNQSYLYFWLDQPEMTHNIKSLNANAAQPGINQSGVRGLPILLPHPTILESFDEMVKPILAELFNLANKNPVLRRTRDVLLPKLISGEVGVEEMKIEMKE